MKQQLGNSKLGARAAQTPQSVKKIKSEEKRAAALAVREYALNNGVSIAVAKAVLRGN